MPLLEIQRSFYDPSHDHGYWSPSTSAANFCEEDYIVSHYVAEFMNTMSNVAYIYYALRPPRIFVAHSVGAGRSVQNRMVLDLPAIALMLVGVCSGLFHASMRAFPQWLDESSMYLLAASWMYVLFTTSYIKDARSKVKGIDSKAGGYQVVRKNRVLVLLILGSTLALASLLSHSTGNLDIHSICFAILLAVSGIRLRYFVRSSTQSTTSDGAAQRKLLFNSLIRAACFLCLGFGLWVVDCNPAACRTLRQVRHYVFGSSTLLYPLSAFTELHAWWHILTARAAGEYLSLVRSLTLTS